MGVSDWRLIHDMPRWARHRLTAKILLVKRRELAWEAINFVVCRTTLVAEVIHSSSARMWLSRVRCAQGGALYIDADWDRRACSRSTKFDCMDACISWGHGGGEMANNIQCLAVGLDGELQACRSCSSTTTCGLARLRQTRSCICRPAAAVCSSAQVV